MSEGMPSGTTQQSNPQSGQPATKSWAAILDDNPASPNAPLSTPNPPVTPAAPVVPAPTGAPSTPPAGAQPGNTPPSGVTPAVVPGAAGAPVTPSNIIQMDEAGLQRLIGAVVPQNQQQPAKTYTEAELNQMFNVYQATAEQLSALGIEATPERIKLFNDMLQGTSKQAATVAEFRLMQATEILKQELAQAFGPALSYYQTQQVEGLKTRFYAAHPDLKDYEPLLLTVRDSMVVRGMKFKSETEAFNTVAEEAKRILKAGGIVPGQNNGAQTPANTQQGQNPPSPMPTLSGGGQGGAGDASRPSGHTKNWQKALADDPK